MIALMCGSYYQDLDLAVLSATQSFLQLADMKLEGHLRICAELSRA
jgi:hypothetical protein